MMHVNFVPNMAENRLHSESFYLQQLLAENARLQEELQQSETRYKFLAEGLPIYVWYGEEGGIEYCNQNLMNFTGLTLEQIRRGETLKLIHRDDLFRVLAETKNSLSTGKPFAQEYRIRGVDNEYHWHLAHNRKFVDSRGHVMWLGTSIDITERKAAEQALQTINKRLSLALDTAKMGDWEWDLDANIVYWSDAVARMHGYDRESFDQRYQSWVTALHPDDRHRVVNAFRVALQSDEPYEVEYRTLRGDADVRWTLARGIVVRHADGSPHRMLGVCMDINSRKQAEDALRRAESLAAVGRLAASISHEINNPLEAVTNLLYLLRNHPQLNQDARELVAVAEQELARVTQIVTQTLKFYKQSNTRTWVDINALLDSVLTLFQRRISGAQVTLVKDFKATKQIHCFDGELRQVFANLVSNAVDAMLGTGGRLELRTRDATHRGSGAAGIRVTVADTGSGIDPSVRARVFDAFFTTKPHTGTGLGLWVSREILRKHGAQLYIKSRTGVPGGTVFSVFLPIESEVSRTKPYAEA
jgi:PAS domain S-box-containing protein